MALPADDIRQNNKYDNSVHVDKSICVFKKIQSCYCSDIRLIPLLLQRQSFNDICNKQQWNEGTHVLNHKAINLCIYLNHAYIFNFIIVVIRKFYSTIQLNGKNLDNVFYKDIFSLPKLLCFSILHENITLCTFYSCIYS